MFGTVITKKLLDSLDIPVGDQFVVYDVAGRKVYFMVKNRKDYRLKQVRGKRKLPIKVRPTDHRFRINYNGTIECDPNKIKELRDVE